MVVLWLKSVVRLNMLSNIGMQQWHDSVLASVNGKVSLQGYELPGFPGADIQAMFVGSAYEHTLREAYTFYQHFHQASLLHSPITQGCRLLDFGCGWGRFLRYFVRDFGPSDLYGVDVDPLIIDICRQTNVPGQLSVITPGGGLPYADNTFSHIIAYSVFTHLPEVPMHQWLSELSRVMRPGGLFMCTVEPPRFLDFVKSIPADAPSGWHMGLRNSAGDISLLERSLEERGYAYIPTGGGSEFRTADIYGDTVIAESYVRTSWLPYFSMLEYLDDPTRFWQAVVTLIKNE